MRGASVRLESNRLGPSSSWSHASFTKPALGVLAFTLGVILFGAVVRITGSGAGCGQHWPTCQGEIVHLPRTMATLIELTHRISSGASAVMVFWLTTRAFRVFATGSPVRRAMLGASFLMLVEALIGALLVRRALVANNGSVARAVVMSLHLLSTSALTASLALATWWSLPRADTQNTPSRGLLALTLAGAVLVVLVSSSGAVTALGDTLYPVRTVELSARIAEVESSSAHFLERLRGLHPVLAVGGALVLLVLASQASARTSSQAARTLGNSVRGLCLGQVALGSLNIWLSAPGYLQILHLLLATLLWLSLVLLAAELAAPREFKGLFGSA